MLDRKPPPRDAFAAEAGLATRPPSQMVLDSFEHHSQAPATQAAIRKEGIQILSDLVVVRPIAARTGLSSEMALDLIAGHDPIGRPQQPHKLSENLVVILSSSPHEHPPDHPALDHFERLKHLGVGY